MGSLTITTVDAVAAFAHCLPHPGSSCLASHASLAAASSAFVGTTRPIIILKVSSCLASHADRAAGTSRCLWTITADGRRVLSVSRVSAEAWKPAASEAQVRMVVLKSMCLVCVGVDGVGWEAV